MKKAKVFYVENFDLFSVKQMKKICEALNMYDELVIAVPKEKTKNLSRVKSGIEDFVSLCNFYPLVCKSLSIKASYAFEQIIEPSCAISYGIFDEDTLGDADQSQDTIVINDSYEFSRYVPKIENSSIINLMELGEYAVLMRYLLPYEHNNLSRTYLLQDYCELTKGKSYGKDILDEYLRDRRYHNYSHVAYCMSVLQEFVLANSDRVIDVRNIKMALFWHDVGTNPEDAKQKFLKAVEDDKDSDDFVFNSSLIEKMIDATDHEKDFAGKFFEAVVHDIDLSILGDHLYYGLYAWKVMQEYRGSASLKEYLEKRVRVLRMFLLKKRIFETQYFYERFEIVARQNIMNEISFWDRFR